MKKRKILVSVISITGAALMGCSGSGSSSPLSEAAKTEGTGEASKTVLIGTGASPKPYIYTDDNDNLIGYEPEVIKAINELLPQYKFKFEKTDFPSIFLGIDSGQYQMGVNNITKKPEREEKYLFADEYDIYNYTVAIVRKGYQGISTLEDLSGKKTYLSGTGGFSQIFVETFNEKHPNAPILTEYSSAEQIKIFQDLAEGVIDFTFMEQVMFDGYVEEYPELAEQLEVVTFTQEETNQIQDPYGWFIYPKTEAGEELKEAVDDALKQLKDEGTLDEIARQWLGYDVSGK
ncbi:MAG: transporter substrate-binding domain-containing protein [Lachnospiraceae bacterium]|nr:transporter substrate-binding domain-containing protein [Lachnospiraceae bacterium]